MVSKDSLILLAPAKVNLTLNVTGKRADGYHLLHSIIAFTSDFGDEITITPADKFKFTQSGVSRNLPSADKNLIVKTAQALAGQFNQSLLCHIHLNKIIPIGAGLGGGSSDAASVIKGLLKLWDITPAPSELHAFMLSIGADIPVCHHRKTCVMQGIGEGITPLDKIRAFHAVLVYPNEFCSTVDVFKNFDSAFTTPSKRGDLIEMIQNGQNDLTTPAIQKIPTIADILNCLSNEENCIFTRMSGSGSCCFGIFNTAENAKVAAINIKKEKPHWWVRSVTLG